ncbi:SMP-30/gluconolactonase/LRE family protein [Microbacterium hydrocarbonoxydans]|uniref:SMP-30/gluconolactonase/LRE family protein n=1 Tax=Microbacterium hydrocarbonoxydans TaxID=273678 RepID=UPI00203DED5D|nr:SMP-30/gluconolactonase/LRE family protein [Microbacterium hydrocarbonoxydans]MCM3778460.1 SMP-30/gluconolactonase/LRE family protein [Microbacterium hydrocarbonoxydans]
MTPENLTGPVCVHAEAPVWSPSWGGVRWVDAEAADLVTLRDDGIHRLHLDDDYAAFVRPRIGGGFVAVGARSLHLADTADGPAQVVTSFDLGSAQFNDGTVDPRGRLLAGSMSTGDDSAAGRVLRIDGDLSSTEILSGVETSNGIGFSPDGTLAYYNDTPTGRVDVFDVVDGELRDRRGFVSIAHDQGMPDGLTVAADGSVWVALWNGSAVHGYSPEGALVARIELPVPQVSACTFGDDDLGTLFITTSAQGLDPDHGTEAGSLFAVRPGVRGMPVVPFAG